MSADGSWSLLDYGNIVVHVFMPETREYYRLEAAVERRAGDRPGRRGGA